GRDDPRRLGGRGALRLHHRPLPGAHQGHHRHEGPGLLRHRPGRDPVPHPPIRRVRTLEVSRGSVRLSVRPPRPAAARLRLRRHATSFVDFPASDPFVLVNVILGAGLLLLTLVFGLDNLRGLIGQRSTRYGASAALYSLLVVALLIGLSYLGVRHHHRWDVTES